MARLEDLTRGAQVSAILPDSLVTVVDAKWHGSNVIELTYKDGAGHLGNELVFREREPSIEIATAGRPWSFDADGAKLRLVSEAYRIRLAHLFNPLLAVHASIVDPLPHHIAAVYDEMLPRQPRQNGGSGIRDFALPMLLQLRKLRSDDFRLTGRCREGSPTNHVYESRTLSARRMRLVSRQGLEP